MRLSHGVMKPTIKRMLVLMKEMASLTVGGGAPAGPPPQAAEMGEHGQKAGATGAVLNVALVVVLFLLVSKPGV